MTTINERPFIRKTPVFFKIPWVFFELLCRIAELGDNIQLFTFVCQLLHINLMFDTVFMVQTQNILTCEHLNIIQNYRTYIFNLFIDNFQIKPRSL